MRIYAGFTRVSGFLAFYINSSQLCISLHISDVIHVINHVKLKLHNMDCFLAVFRHLLNLIPGVIKFQMRVGVQGHAYV